MNASATVGPQALPELQQQVEQIIAEAARQGASACEVAVSLEQGLSTTVRQGEVVEYGSAEQVLLRPQNPYTQTLLAAAPGAKAIPTSPHEPPLRLIQPSRH